MSSFAKLGSDERIAVFQGQVPYLNCLGKLPACSVRKAPCHLTRSIPYVGTSVSQPSHKPVSMCTLEISPRAKDTNKLRQPSNHNSPRPDVM
eukprot:6643833-Prorocentrum_lima.AAC.1